MPKIGPRSEKYVAPVIHGTLLPVLSLVLQGNSSYGGSYEVAHRPTLAIWVRNSVGNESTRDLKCQKRARRRLKGRAQQAGRPQRRPLSSEPSHRLTEVCQNQEVANNGDYRDK